MPDAENVADTGAGKRSKLPIALGAAGFLLLGAGGFYAAYAGLLPIGGASSHGEEDAHGKTTDTGHDTAPSGDHAGASLDVAFVPIEPLIINLGPGASNRHLRFRAELEVETDQAGDVSALMPRIVDVMNSYLRAVSVTDLEAPAALIRLRSQLLRRIQVATGEGVRDLLVMEFVLN